MTTEADQAAGQLDEATVLRVLEMIHEYVREADARDSQEAAEGFYQSAAVHSYRATAGRDLSSRLVAMYRVSRGLEEA